VTTSDQLCTDLRRQADSVKWRELAEITMSRVIVFNARRGSEVADLRMSEYEKKTNHVQQNLLDSMDDNERHLVNRYVGAQMVVIFNSLFKQKKLFKQQTGVIN
jgi:hypothetical protein